MVALSWELALSSAMLQASREPNSPKANPLCGASFRFNRQLIEELMQLWKMGQKQDRLISGAVVECVARHTLVHQSRILDAGENGISVPEPSEALGMQGVPAMARAFLGSSVARRGMTSLASGEVHAAHVWPPVPTWVCSEAA